MKQKKPLKISLYWTCQLLGWGSAAVYWSYFQIRDDFPLWIGIGTVLAPFLTGIGSTHLYKRLAHRSGWIHLDLKQLIPRLVLALTALTTCYIVVGYYLVLVPFGDISTSGFLGMATGGLRYMSIWLLAFHLYHHARHSRQAEINQAEYEKLALAAQFKQLNSELNPHFLFNSLNSVKALILENPKAAREAIDLLSGMLRSSLQYTDGKLIPLQEEIRRISDYLALEKIRFEERLQYSFDIKPETRDIRILPLSLYNLVENAIKHGISKSKSGGHIKISSFVEDDKLHLVVVNDGTLGDTSGNGVGLQNVAERLRLVYGPVASLDLKFLTQNQVASSLILPVS